jgi:hypothetical protein
MAGSEKCAGSTCSVQCRAERTHSFGHPGVRAGRCDGRGGAHGGGSEERRAAPRSQRLAVPDARRVRNPRTPPGSADRRVAQSESKHNRPGSHGSSQRGTRSVRPRRVREPRDRAAHGGATRAALGRGGRHTCELNGANPFDYLTELLRHAEELKRSPSAWMPWNYRETLARLATPTAA